MESSLKNGHAKQGCHSMIQPMSSLVEKCGLLVAQPVQDSYMLQVPYIPYRGACRAISCPPMLCVLIYISRGLGVGGVPRCIYGLPSVGC